MTVELTTADGTIEYDASILVCTINDSFDKCLLGASTKPNMCASLTSVVALFLSPTITTETFNNLF